MGASLRAVGDGRHRRRGSGAGRLGAGRVGPPPAPRTSWSASTTPTQRRDPARGFAAARARQARLTVVSTWWRPTGYRSPGPHPGRRPGLARALPRRDRPGAGGAAGDVRRRPGRGAGAARATRGRARGGVAGRRPAGARAPRPVAAHGLPPRSGRPRGAAICCLSGAPRCLPALPPRPRPGAGTTPTRLSGRWAYSVHGPAAVPLDAFEAMVVDALDSLPDWVILSSARSPSSSRTSRRSPSDAPGAAAGSLPRHPAHDALRPAPGTLPDTITLYRVPIVEVCARIEDVPAGCAPCSCTRSGTRWGCPRASSASSAGREAAGPPRRWCAPPTSVRRSRSSSSPLLLAVADDLSATRVVLVGLAVLAGQLSVGWSNDLVDERRDRAVARPTSRSHGDGRHADGAGRLRAGRARSSSRCRWPAAGRPASSTSWRSPPAWTYNICSSRRSGPGCRTPSRSAPSWCSWASRGSRPTCRPGRRPPRPRCSAWVPTWSTCSPTSPTTRPPDPRSAPSRRGPAAGGGDGRPGRRVAGRRRRDRPHAHGSLVALATVVVLAVVALAGRGRAPFAAAIGIALVDVVLLVARRDRAAALTRRTSGKPGVSPWPKLAPELPGFTGAPVSRPAQERMPPRTNAVVWSTHSSVRPSGPRTSMATSAAPMTSSMMPTASTPARISPASAAARR